MPILPVIIRHRHNAASVEIGPQGVLHGAKLITGNRIPVQMRDASVQYYPYSGAIYAEQLANPRWQKVKLVDLTAYRLDEYTPWQDVAKNHYCVGGYHQGGLYLALANNRPIQFRLPSTGQKITDNVFPLKR